MHIPLADAHPGRLADHLSRAPAVELPAPAPEVLLKDPMGSSVEPTSVAHECNPSDVLVCYREELEDAGIHHEDHEVFGVFLRVLRG